jgi:hypothetical protein
MLGECEINFPFGPEWKVSASTESTDETIRKLCLNVFSHFIFVQNGGIVEDVLVYADTVKSTLIACVDVWPDTPDLMERGGFRYSRVIDGVTVYSKGRIL